MEFSERKHQTLEHSSTIFHILKCIISYLLREISSYCELVSCSSEQVPFLPQNFQIRWFVRKLNPAYS